MASTFDNAREVQLVGQEGSHFVSTHATASHDELEGAPLF
jgi:hypothetical protein